MLNPLQPSDKAQVGNRGEEEEEEEDRGDVMQAKPTFSLSPGRKEINVGSPRSESHLHKFCDKRSELSREISII